MGKRCLTKIIYLLFFFNEIKFSFNNDEIVLNQIYNFGEISVGFFTSLKMLNNDIIIFSVGNKEYLFGFKESGEKLFDGENDGIKIINSTDMNSLNAVNIYFENKEYPLVCSQKLCQLFDLENNVVYSQQYFKFFNKIYEKNSDNSNFNLINLNNDNRILFSMIYDETIILGITDILSKNLSNYENCYIYFDEGKELELYEIEKLNCFITKKSLIECFYTDLFIYYVAIFNEHLSLLNTIEIDEVTDIDKYFQFINCIHLYEEVGIFTYYKDENTLLLQINELKFDGTEYFFNNKIDDEHQINLSEGVNNFIFAKNENLMKITDTKFSYIYYNLDNEENYYFIILIIFDLYGDNNENLFSRYYKIKIDSFGITNFDNLYNLDTIMFKSYIGIGLIASFIGNNDSKSYLIIIGNAKENINEIELNITPNYEWKISNDFIITIHNNIFGYELAYKISYVQNSLSNLKFFSINKNKQVEIDEEIDIEDSLKFDYSNSNIKANELQIIKIAAMITEPEFEKLETLCEYIKRDGGDDPKDYYQKRIIDEKILTAKLNFSCYSTCDSCEYAGYRIDEPKCLSCKDDNLCLKEDEGKCYNISSSNYTSFINSKNISICVLHEKTDTTWAENYSENMAQNETTNEATDEDTMNSDKISETTNDLTDEDTMNSDKNTETTNEATVEDSQKNNENSEIINKSTLEDSSNTDENNQDTTISDENSQENSDTEEKSNDSLNTDESSQDTSNTSEFNQDTVNTEQDTKDILNTEEKDSDIKSDEKNYDTVTSEENSSQNAINTDSDSTNNENNSEETTNTYENSSQNTINTDRDSTNDENYSEETTNTNENSVDSISTSESSSEIEDTYKINWTSLYAELINDIPDSIIEAFNVFYNKIQEGSYDDIINDEIIIYKKNMTIQATTSSNLKYYIQNGIKTNFSIIDFSECEKKIGLNKSLIIVKTDITKNESYSPQVEYIAINPYSHEVIDLSICEGIKINVYVDYNISNDNLNLYTLAESQGYNIFNPSDPFYNDICTPFNSHNNTDVLIKDRKIDYYTEYDFCEEGCDFDNINLNLNKAKCDCQVKTEIQTDTKFSSNKLIENFYKFNSYSNLKAISCYKLVFSKYLFKNNNYGSYCLICISSIFIFSIFGIIFTYKKYLDRILASILMQQAKIFNIDIKERKSVENNPQDSKKVLFTISDIKKQKKKIKKSHSFKQNGKEKDNLKNKKLINERKKLRNSDKKFFLKKINKNIDSPPKKRFYTKQISIHFKTGDKTNDGLANSTLKSQELSIFKKSRNKNLISIKKEYNNKKNKNLDIIKIIINNVEKEKRYKYFVDEELNKMPYKYAVEIDNRRFFQYYWSLIKLKHVIILTFVANDDYNLFLLKFEFFLISFSLYFTLCTLFFTDGSIHKEYISKGKYNFLYQMPKIIYTSTISTIINTVLKKLSLSQTNLLRLKHISNMKTARESSLKVKRNLKIKFTIFIIIGLILLFFFWYFISCFCCVFSNSQKSLIKNIIISYILSMLYPLGINLLPGMFRIHSLRRKNKENIYNFSRILAFI